MKPTHIVLTDKGIGCIEAPVRPIEMRVKSIDELTESVYQQSLKKAITHVVLFKDEMARTGFILDIPIICETPSEIKYLRVGINSGAPRATAPTTDTERGIYRSDICNYAMRCPMPNGVMRVYITDTTAIPVMGQVTATDLEYMFAPSPLVVQMDPPTFNAVSTATAINYGAAKDGGVTHISVTAGGTGYTSAPTVTFTGGGGSGAAATAYIANGAITGIVVTNVGTGFTSEPAIGFSGGGGSGAAATAVVNTHLLSVTVTYTDALASNVAVGMLVGHRDLVGTNDTASLNGALVVSSFDTGARTITYTMTAPRSTALADGTATDGDGVFPAAWFVVKGGYTGSISGKEAFWNASGKGEIQLIYVNGVFSQEGQTQLLKSSQSYIMTGYLGGRVHIYSDMIVSNFPNYAFRQVSGITYINRLCAGGGIMGSGVVLVQNGGWSQLVRLSAGSSKNDALVVGRGCAVYISSSDIAASTKGIDQVGGFIDFQTTTVAGCFYGIYADVGGFSYGGATGAIANCDYGIFWDNGARVIAASGNITGSIVAAGTFVLSASVPVNSEVGTGGWFDNNYTTVARKYWSTTVYDMITYRGTATLDLDNVVANTAPIAQVAAADATITVTGATTSMYAKVIFLGDAQGLMFNAWVSAANTVKFRAANCTAGGINLASGTFLAEVRAAS